MLNISSTSCCSSEKFTSLMRQLRHNFQKGSNRRLSLSLLFYFTELFRLRKRLHKDILGDSTIFDGRKVLKAFLWVGNLLPCELFMQICKYFSIFLLPGISLTRYAFVPRCTCAEKGSRVGVGTRFEGLTIACLVSWTDSETASWWDSEVRRRFPRSRLCLAARQLCAVVQDQNNSDATLCDQ